MNAFGAFMKRPSTKIGIIVALMFQLVFACVWMTAYDGITDNVKNLSIGIVNEDQAVNNVNVGKTVEENLKSNLTFKLTTYETVDKAKDALENRDIAMIIHIPTDLTKLLQTPGQKGKLEFTINESNPVMSNSVMESVSTKVTDTVNKSAIANGLTGFLMQTAHIQPADKAKSMADGFSEKVTSDVQKIHQAGNYNKQMLPLMLVLASFVGAMIMSGNLYESFNAIADSFGKWARYLSMMIVNIIASILAGLVATALVWAFSATSDQGFFTVWMFITLMFFTFAVLAQMWFLLFSNAGQLFNMIVLAVQLVSSGAMVPRAIMSDFYQNIGNLFPASHSVEAMMNLFYGGPGIGSLCGNLFWIALVCIACALVGVAVRKNKVASESAVAA